MNKTIASVVAASCLALGVNLAHAEGEKCGTLMHASGHHGEMDEMTFHDLDTNGDAVISRREFDAFNARYFKELDTNKDGKVTRQEYFDAMPLLQVSRRSTPAETPKPNRCKHSRSDK